MQPTSCPGNIAPCANTPGTCWTRPKRSSAVQKASLSAGNQERAARRGCKRRVRFATGRVRAGCTMHAGARQYAGFPEAVVLAVSSRRVGGKRHLLQRGTVPPHVCATPDLPDRLGTARRFLDVLSLLRIS